MATGQLNTTLNGTAGSARNRRGKYSTKELKKLIGKTVYVVWESPSDDWRIFKLHKVEGINLYFTGENDDSKIHRDVSVQDSAPWIAFAHEIRFIAEYDDRIRMLRKLTDDFWDFWNEALHDWELECLK